jgi:5'-nucleotidase
MIISGINRGANLGDDLLYSGTVAAAMEGRFLGYPAMAISLVNPSYGYSHENFTHFDTAAKVAQILLKHLLMDPLPPESILNVNVPDLPFAELKGFQVTRMGHRHMAEKMIQSQDGKGHPVYWVGPPSKEQDAGPGTDFYAVNQGYVSITPIKVDLTDYSAMSRLAKWTEDIKDHHGTIFTPV